MIEFQCIEVPPSFTKDETKLTEDNFHVYLKRSFCH